jgi:hypothetical protein
VIVWASNELGSTLFTFILTSLKPNTQFVCRFGCTVLNLAQVILNYFLAQLGFLKTCSEIGNLLLQLSVLFGSMEKLTLDRATHFAWRG